MVRLSLHILAILCSIAGVAFFAGSETSFVSCNRFRIRTMARKHIKGAAAARSLLNNPATLLSATLVGTNILVVLSSSLTTILLAEAVGSYSVVVSTVALTVVLMVFGEIIPKAVARAEPEAFLLRAAGALRVAYLLLYPVARATALLASVFVKSPPGERAADVTRDEIRALVKEAAQSGHIYDAPGYAHRVFDLSRMKVSGVMVPMDEVVCIDEKATVTEAIKSAAQSGHSRYPVYRKSVENIVGMLHLKHLLGVREESSVRIYARRAHFIPETKTVKAALGEMRGDPRHMSVVTDEYGRPLGVVTFEDLVEEIMGEISDEYDQYAVPGTGRTRIVNGGTPIEVINEEFDAHIPEGAYDTLAGFILDRAGAVCTPGETIEFGNLLFRVIQVRGKRISKVRISRREDEEER
jgi:putative hemolysin